MRLSERVPASCSVRGVVPSGDLPRVGGRDQLDADLLLEWTEALPRGDDEQLVCLTGHDIGSRIIAYFFGRARLDGGAAVVSIARLDPIFYGLPRSDKLLVQRTVKEILHELGHGAGLHHCRDPECLMHFSADVESIDLRGADYCALCHPAARTLFAVP